MRAINFIAHHDWDKVNLRGLEFNYLRILEVILQKRSS